ncbi:MAG: YiiD C-terminal domain-containing protein [Lacunisphaera sp.]
MFYVATMSEHTPASMTPAGLEAYLREKIPLSRAMEVRVIENNPTRLVLEAPLAANINHLGSAFGGSLHALPTLACYSTLWTIMREAGTDGHVVVKHSEANYRSPVKGRLRAVCVRPHQPVITRFLEDLHRHKKARMELEAIVEGEAGKPAVEFHGTFVAIV